MPPFPSNPNIPFQPSGPRRQSRFEWGRWPTVFEPGESMFAPGEPLAPIQQEQVRTYDFPVGINQIIFPRTPETFGFAELRAFSNVELVRLAIETRKDQVENLDWQVKPRKDRFDNKGSVKTRKDSLPRIRAAEKFISHPNRYDDFHVWLRIIMEDLLVLDAPALEKRRTREGALWGLDYVPGDTIKLLVDSNGRRPENPAPAYQQIIKGRVWADLTQDDILYMPRNPRSGKLYGFGPVEQCIVTINTIMRRQASQLAYFSDGTVPAGMATVPEGWNVDNTKDYQEWVDSVFSGNLAERRKILWAPHGSAYQAFKEPPLKDDFDEWLARVVCYCFSLPPTPFIRQMNRSTAVQDNERALKEGLAPLLNWAKRIIDWTLHEELGFSDLEFVWHTDEEVDIKTQAEINNLYLRAAVITINEVRDEMGLDAIPDGDTPLIYTSQGAQTLEMALTPSMNPANAENDRLDNSPGASDSQPKPKKTTAKADDDRIQEIASIVGGIEALRTPILRAIQHSKGLAA